MSLTSHLPMLSIVGLLACASPSPTRSEQPSAPNVPIAESIVEAKANPSSPAQALDWQTRTYVLPLWVGELMAGTYTVEGGRGEYADGSSVFVHEPIFVDVDQDGVDEAAMILVYDGGGSGKFSIGLAYSVASGKPSLLGFIPGGDRAHGGLGELSAGARGQILVERFESSGGACCASHILTERWRWQGGSLKIDPTKTARREAPDWH